jgi:hypothetical protein
MPTFDSGQFGAFDGRDNRKTVLELFVRLGNGLPDAVANIRRAGFLQALLSESRNGFASKPMTVGPCTAVEAYHLFVAICGVLGVPVETGAKLLEQRIRRRKL